VWNRVVSEPRDRGRVSQLRVVRKFGPADWDQSRIRGTSDLYAHEARGSIVFLNFVGVRAADRFSFCTRRHLRATNSISPSVESQFHTLARSTCCCPSRPESSRFFESAFLTPTIERSGGGSCSVFELRSRAADGRMVSDSVSTQRRKHE
jgi:hypothetical protein